MSSLYELGEEPGVIYKNGEKTVNLELWNTMKKVFDESFEKNENYAETNKNPEHSADKPAKKDIMDFVNRNGKSKSTEIKVKQPLNKSNAER